MSSINRVKFCLAIKRYRKERELTQNELAQKLMTTITTVARWELGTSVPKTGIMLQQLKKIGIKW